MNKTPSRRWRADTHVRMALRLHALYAASRTPQHSDLDHAVGRLLPRMRAIQMSWQQFRAAQSRDWHAAERRLQQRLLDQLQDLRMAVEPAISPLRQMLVQRAGGPPTVRALYEELAALRYEFDDVAFDFSANTIHVVTDAVTLDDTPLGRFRIVLDLSRLNDRYQQPLYAVRTVAIDPNPAGTEPAVTHPHVRDDVPCLGDACLPVRNALIEGRLLDAFQLIDRVLHTYNDGSAYVQLEDWSGAACEECDRIASSDDLSSCDNCGCRLCEDCCYCCDRCSSTYCRSCLTERSGVGRNSRDSRLLCNACIQKESEDEDDQDDLSDDEEADAQPDTDEAAEDRTAATA